MGFHLRGVKSEVERIKIAVFQFKPPTNISHVYSLHSVTPTTQQQQH